MFARFSAVLLITGLALASPAVAHPTGSPVFAFGPDDGAAAAVLAVDFEAGSADQQRVAAATFEILPEFGIPTEDWPVTAASFEILPEFGIPMPELPAEPSFADLLEPAQSLASAPVDPDRFLRFDSSDSPALETAAIRDSGDRTTGSILPRFEEMVALRPRCMDETHALQHTIERLAESREAYEARLTP